jgi:hypothetical protein
VNRHTNHDEEERDRTNDDYCDIEYHDNEIVCLKRFSLLTQYNQPQGPKDCPANNDPRGPGKQDQHRLGFDPG